MSLGVLSLSACLASASEAEPAACGKLTSDATIGSDSHKGLYVIRCNLTVGAGATLTIEPGTVVKVPLGAKLTVEGSLIAEGTSREPVIFTSVRDSSVGGETGGDRTAPAAGDWQGIVAQKGGVVELQQTAVRYATTGLRGEPGSSLSVRRSEISHVSASAIRGFKLAAVTVTDSTVGDFGAAAMMIEGDALDPEDLSGNSTIGHAGGMQLAGTFTRSGVLKEGRGLVAQIGTDQGDDLRIAADATLAIPDGQTVKGTLGRKLIVDGKLLAEGTNREPVTFTSIRDSSVGGETGGDRTAPAAGDWQGIVAQKGGVVELQQTAVRYATTGLRGEPGSSLSVRRSEISEVTSNAIRGFRLVAVTVADSVFGNAGGPAMVIDSADLDPENLSGNSALAAEGMQLSGTFSRSGVLKERRGLVAQIGTDQGDDLRIAADATLAIPDGQTVKGTLGRKLIVDGKLLAEGTNREPVTFTSIRDSSVGGDTGGDRATPPAAGDWDGIVARPGSTVRLDATTLQYATTALTAQRGATVEVHGQILDSTLGIAGTSDPVDATNVYWGDPSGPAPIGTGVPFTGSGVVVQPWIR